MVEKLVVDTKLFEDLGMTILTEQDVKSRRQSLYPTQFPEGYSFAPRGVTLEEARYAMSKCRES